MTNKQQTEFDLLTCLATRELLCCRYIFEFMKEWVYG